MSPLGICLHLFCIFQKINTLDFESIEPLLQSRIAILEEFAHFTLIKKLSYSALFLLGLDKCMDLVKCPARNI
ncbi:hypothetical protein FB451DRAFT_1239318, partial [Mycena latifolia]